MRWATPVRTSKGSADNDRKPGHHDRDLGPPGDRSQGREPAQRNLGEMQRRAAILLELLQEKKETVIIPSIMVSELLVKVEPSKHGTYIAELQKRFFIPLFDLPAAALAASLWLQHRELPKDERDCAGDTQVRRDDYCDRQGRGGGKILQ